MATKNNQEEHIAWSRSPYPQACHGRPSRVWLRGVKSVVVDKEVVGSRVETTQLFRNVSVGSLAVTEELGDVGQLAAKGLCTTC